MRFRFYALIAAAMLIGGGALQTISAQTLPPPSPFAFVTNTPFGATAPPVTHAPVNTPVPAASVDAEGTPMPTWTPPPPDPAAQIADHYRLQRPINSDNVNYADRTYPYGGTSGGSLQVHHGVDLVNPTGVNVLAADDGVVVFAGDDLTQVIGLSPDYYGNAVIIQHTNFSAADSAPVYTLYGHLSKVEVTVGQSVAAGDKIGEVGAAGVAFGPHLHFEVRVGDPFSFDATRNPDLWIYPYRNFGTLAGRVTDSAGNILYSAPIQVRSLQTQSLRYTFSYADNSVHGDSVFNENFTVGDIPANYYEVSVNDGQRVRFRKTIYVYPNQTTWIDIQLN